MTNTYVLIPGFWLGGWAWRTVAELLRGRGHDVRTMTLTGLGERVHLASPEITLETHIEDLLNLLRYEDLHDVVLVGHSYAGAVVVPSVADRAPERIAKLVFVDSGPMPNGMCQAEFGSPEEQVRNAELVDQLGDGWRLPPPRWVELGAGVPGLTPADIDRLEALSVPQPWATATTPLKLTGAWEEIPRLAVLSSFTAQQALDMAAAMPALRHMTDSNWTFEELPTWHWPMFTRPTDLANILHAIGEARK